ncbi:MAG: hypothetical protein R3B82_16710 [Sandaracinaceae bacterium]
MRERSDPTLRSPFVAGVLRAARLDADTRQRGGLDARRERRSLEDERLGGAWARRPGGPAPEEPRPELDETPLTWIGIELVAEDGTPVAGERYRVEMEDGSLRTGRLDARGRAELRGVRAGTCRVSFPNLPEAGIRRL